MLAATCRKQPLSFGAAEVAAVAVAAEFGVAVEAAAGAAAAAHAGGGAAGAKFRDLAPSRIC
ncbi:hypothetical protein AYJ54_39960 [Bradyrhizobium centrolobii]|uniref:Uncharacterized protein n=1 Tax=Bradyrhizobium centrolobii TaxID=1505087 RepID=A0A176Z490_9BRAD|nr:hypothetical protein AYJ54_39960 [Bradyrhizobium centrolobii]